MRIRWKMIKRITEGIAEKKVQIHISTALVKLIAFISEDNEILEILLNASACKRERDAVVATAHEVTHHKLKSDKHDAVFNQTLEETLSVFKEKMGFDDEAIEDAKERLSEIAS
jgi:hypothetical protein